MLKLTSTLHHIITCFTLSCLKVSQFYAYFCDFFLSHHQITPLHMAAEGGQVGVMKYLASKVADINVKDQNGVKICTTDIRLIRLS